MSLYMQGGMPLPRSLSSSAGRRKASVLLAATKGKQLKLRFLRTQPAYGRTNSYQAAEASEEINEKRYNSNKSPVASGGKSKPDVNTLRDPFGEFSSGDKTDKTVKLPQIH
jgi:hypothetical protein